MNHLDEWHLSFGLVSTGVAIQSAQAILLRPAERGFVSQSVSGTLAPAGAPVLPGGHGAWKFLHVTRFGVATVCIVGACLGFRHALMGAMSCLLLLLSLAHRSRQRIGDSGGGQQSMIVLFGLCSLWLGGDGLWVGAGFVTLQLALCYTTAGVSKLKSASWREGHAIVGAMSTRAYGREWMAKLFRQRPLAAKFATYSVIGWQLSVLPAMLSMDDRLLKASLLGGVGFHLATGILMGLGSFFWSFTAAYPLVLWLFDHIIPN